MADTRLPAHTATLPAWLVLLATISVSSCGDSAAPPSGAGQSASASASAGTTAPAPPSPHDWAFAPGALPTQDEFDAEAEETITPENLVAEFERLKTEILADL